MTAFFFTQALSSYLDVISGSVDTADGHAQATQAALAHVAGDGAAHTQWAQQGVPAWLRDRNGSEGADSLRLKGFMEGDKVCSQMPQSLQQS